MPSSHDPGRFRFIVHALLTIAVIFVFAVIASRFAPWEITAGNLVLRSQRGMTYPFSPPSAHELATAFPREVAVADDEPRPRNVILMIGDGMGVGQVSTASALLHGPVGGLGIESAPITGLVRTHAGNELATDSAAAATAMATGFKAPKTAISILVDGRIPVTLMEAVKTSGLGTAVVTTSGLADATPAGFLVHADDRYQYAHIFSSILATRHDVLIGGTWVHHHRAKRDEAYLELVKRADELGAAAGYHVVRSEADLGGARIPVLGFFDPRGHSESGHGPALSITTEFALEALANHEAGFFAVIESEVTDAAGHHNSIVEVVDAVREFDDAVTLAVDWADRRGDTLVLVTADHDTGGLGIFDGDYDDGVAEVRWITDLHTAHWVPLFAFGPGAEHFSGVIDNTEIGVRIAKLLEIEDFPRFHP